jgi:antitoxin (DNA-binding transcriptional repressor) of toxin-antitoxin stability system
VVIAKAGKPLARLVPVEVPRVTLGFMKGKIHLSDNFGDPLPDDVLDQFFGTTPETTERK